jgi:antirestriction protein ArdC
VRGGEKGTAVTYWGKSKPKKSDPDANPFMFMKVYTVFNAEQIDGLPEKFSAPVTEATEVDRDAATEAYIAAIGADVRHGGDKAFYVPSQDYIQLPAVDDFSDYAAYAGTSIHEHAHWTGAEKRLDRDIKNGFGSKDYAREELVAECSAALICGHLGLEVEPREDHASYLASWLEVLKEDKTAIRKAFSQAQKVVDFLDDLQPEELEQAA